jgi:hypothetical protein
MWVVMGIWYGGQCDFWFDAVRLVSGSFGCSAANVEAAPMCNINILYVYTYYISILHLC